MRPVRGRSGYLYFLCRQKVPKVLVLRYGAGGNFVVLLSPNKRIKRGFRSVSPYGEEEGGCTFCVDKKYQKATRGGQLWRLRPGRCPLAAPPLTNFYASATGLERCGNTVERERIGALSARRRRQRNARPLLFGRPGNSAALSRLVRGACDTSYLPSGQMICVFPDMCRKNTP